ncbi:MAG: DNA-directed RNA polymerase subunit N (RpoN/RPB10) [Hyphomicrobiaceae bacterium]|jgi:DNA-directed RNA polymerase subunit N (RpoN/RPB10)
MLGFLTFDDEPEQYLFTSVLRSGQATAKLGAVAILRRAIALVREAFPGTTIRERRETVALFGQTRYAARSWEKNKRRVIYKAEVTRLEGREPPNNPRFVVTNMKLAPRNIYKIYRMRGESENRIKELLYDLGLARMSCSRFAANQMRSLLVAAAYVIMQTLRCRVSGTRLGRKQVGTLRMMLLKIGGKIRASVRRITIHLAANHPWREEWLLAAKAWRAIPT